MEGTQENQPAAAGEQRNSFAAAAAAVASVQPTDAYLFLALFVTTIFIWNSAWFLVLLTDSYDFVTLVLDAVSLLVALEIDILFFCCVQKLRSPQNSNQNPQLEQSQNPAPAGRAFVIALFVVQFSGLGILFVAVNFIWVSAWVLANLINSNPDFAPLVPLSVVVAWAIDVLFFCGVGVQVFRSSQNNNQNLQPEQPQPLPAVQVQNPSKKSWLTKDLCDVICLFAGLGIQQHLNVISFTSFVLWISCLARVIICFLILKHPEDYRFIDLYIALFTQGVVYFNKTKRIILFLLTFILCVGLVIWRNHSDELSIYFNKTKRTILWLLF